MAEDLWDSQQPLSNEQFRQLLETPLHKRKAALGEQRHGKHREAAKKAKATPLKQEMSDESPILPETTLVARPAVDEPLDRPLYRDRARERREGTNLEYDSALGAESEGLVLPADRSVEESKFLGGDLEHTHLVKGLDYALLNKERARIQKTESEQCKKEQHRKEKQRKAKKGITFASPMGRAVYSALFKPAKVEARDFFRPGRMAFLYTLDDDKALDYRPTVLRRPKAECQEGGEHVMANMDSAVVHMLAKIISYLQPSTMEKAQKKVQKAEKQQLLESLLGPLHSQKSQKTETPITEPDTKEEVLEPVLEDDIFMDAGTDYTCDLTRKKKKSSDVSKPISHLPQPKVKSRKELESDDHEMLKMDKKTGKDIDPTYLPDHYAECYPGFHQSYSGAVVDSDDEDFSQMDARNKGVSRYSFETDEEWSKYKQSMEQMPKAAFQYGVKMTDGRKTHSKLVEKRRKEQKMDTQLNKIEKLLKDQGRSLDTAFSSEKKSETPKEEEAAQSTLPAPKNRKRIRLAGDD